jgi:hypothetical protein
MSREKEWADSGHLPPVGRYPAGDVLQRRRCGAGFLLPGFLTTGSPGEALCPSRLLRDRSRDDYVESLGSERGIVTKVEVDVALEHAIGVERGPAATAHIVALVGALPRELNAWPAITIRVAAVEFSRDRYEAQLAEAVIIELDEAGLDQIDGFLIPVVHLGDTPPAYDARALGHATRVAPEPFGREAVNRRLAALGSGQP